MRSQIRFARALVWLNVPVYLAVGLGALFAPHWLSTQLGIQLTTPNAVCDFSAMYGGLSCAAAITMLVGLRQPNWLRPTLAFVGLFAAELAFGRSVAWFTAGAPNGLMLASLSAELLTAALAYWSFQALGRGAEAVSHAAAGVLSAARG